MNIKDFVAGTRIKQLAGCKSFIPNDIKHPFILEDYLHRM